MSHALSASARKALLFLAGFLASATVAASVRSVVMSEDPAVAANQPPVSEEQRAVSEKQPAISEEQPAESEKSASVGTTTGEALPAFDRSALFLPGTDVAVSTDAPSFTPKQGAVEIAYISYGRASYHGSKSRIADGEKANPGDLTAAHPTLPIGTRVRVTNLFTGNSVTVRINDRGPIVRGRIVDVSYPAAKQLGMVGTGVAHVRLEVVE